MKNEHGFVIVLISSGKEVGDLPDIYSTGTYVEITDWEALDSTLLGITVTGIKRVKIRSTTADKNGLMAAKTEDFTTPLEESLTLESENTFNNLVDTLRQLAEHPFVAQNYPSIDYSSPYDVCYRLSELLPISNTIKQDLLETENINSYIEKLAAIINSLGGQ
jgi:Lon protease-like protein